MFVNVTLKHSADSHADAYNVKLCVYLPHFSQLDNYTTASFISPSVSINEGLACFDVCSSLCIN